MKPPFLRTGLALLGCIFALSACAGDSEPIGPADTERPIEAPKLASRRLVTRGTALVDTLGRKVILRGVNVGGRSKMPPYLPVEIPDGADLRPALDGIMNSVKKIGANGIRLVMSWEALESTRGSYDTSYLDRYRAMLDAADRAGLSVIIDYHQDVFQAAFCGDGFPEWALFDIPHGPPRYDCGALLWSIPYFNPTSEVSRAFDGLWDNREGLLDSFVAMWSKVAREFGKHPAVAAFEVINEPGSGSRTTDVVGATVLPAVYDRVAQAIEAEAGPSAVLGDDPIAPVNDVARLGRPEHARFTYAPHFYDPLATIGIPLDEPRIRSEVTAILERGEMYGAPVVLGEFGVTNTYAQKAEFLTAVLDAADSRRASAIAWEASIATTSWNAEDFSVLTPEGVERPWGAVVDRPVPRAIDGTILAMQWDAPAKKFTLSVEGEGDNVSEIYLPTRHFGAEPKVTVIGARHRWIAESSTLLVAPDRGASWSIVAEAAASVR